MTWETVSELTLWDSTYCGGMALGPWTRLNATLIASQAPGSGMGHAHEWLDGGVEGGRTYFYLLEEWTAHPPCTGRSAAALGGAHRGRWAASPARLMVGWACPLHFS